MYNILCVGLPRHRQLHVFLLIIFLNKLYFKYICLFIFSLITTYQDLELKENDSASTALSKDNKKCNTTYRLKLLAT